LERRAVLITVGLLTVLAAGSWWLTIERARGMDDMTIGLTSVATAMMPFDMNAAVFMLMWITMMIAMMFPTIAPIVLLHRALMRRSGTGTSSTVTFALGYLAVWAAAGIAPLTALVVFRHFSSGTAWVPYAAGVVLVVAGAYQFTEWKAICQRACQSPMGFLVTHNVGSNLGSAFRTGVSHGLFCLGCCWALMTVLFVVGLMSLPWMAAISVVFLIEKHWKHGLLLARLVGAAVALAGLSVLVHPAVLTTLAS